MTRKAESGGEQLYPCTVSEIHPVYPEGISGKRGRRERPYVMLPSPDQNAAASDLRKNAEGAKETTKERR